MWAALDSDGTLEERLRGFLLTWLRQLREDERFRALLTLTLHTSHGPDRKAPSPASPSGTPSEGSADAEGWQAKAFGLADWQGRLQRALGRDRPRRAAGADGAAAHLLAWLCGTALLAATDPDLLPPAGVAGVAPVLRGVLP
ncbi:hypothetical protein [Streptomyces sp. ISL-11]|uniref:hypothetical protein n=1 Tax=Streptomyces sp. ISL-11 TaxID=2819174 RepID=UPI001BE6EF9E|nr:hypothetical protein [Streptomyces sp. ISL-11]MBT2384134.1 hypothetical protein [Streptomyces sp. ISL-11]